MPGQVFLRGLAEPNYDRGEAESRKRKLVRGGCARESRVGHYLFSLGPMALAMGSNEQEPLVAVAGADDRVRESVLPEFGLGIGGEFSGAFANGLEFRKELVVRPPARGHQPLGTFHAIRATRYPSHEVVVAHSGTGRIRHSLQSLLNIA
jgi:hypothetical protein